MRIIDEMKSAGCGAVALSCTELPLLVTPEISPLPTVDFTRLRARDALAAAVANRAPTWRGRSL